MPVRLWLSEPIVPIAHCPDIFTRVASSESVWLSCRLKNIPKVQKERKSWHCMEERTYEYE